MKLPFKIPSELGTTAWIGVTLLSATACVPSKTKEIWGDNYGQGAASNAPFADDYQPEGDMNVGRGSDHVAIPSAPDAARNAATGASDNWANTRKSGSGSHVVVTGDTLWGLGIEYGVTVEQIQEANQLNGAFIKAGQKLRIP